MADTVSKSQRSAIMQTVKGSGNKSTEVRLIEIFKDLGIKGWKRNYAVKGKPDFVFLKQRIAVFTDGCFWHGHHCRNITPKQNADYWDKKRQQNIERDIKVTQYLQGLGWKVIRIWECDLRKKNIDFSILMEI